MNTRALVLMVTAFVIQVISSPLLLANNLKIENVSLGERDTAASSVALTFDISWDNSWRNKINHDAVWLTARIYDSASDGKVLCPLTAAGLNPAGTTRDDSGVLEMWVPSDKSGVFIRRSANARSQAISADNLKITIDFGACGFSGSSNVSADLFGLEMVYIPEGSFYAGDSASTAAFRQGSADADAWQIFSESPIMLTAATSDAYYYSSAGLPDEFPGGQAFTLPAEFPKGYNAFYMMKYEINEGQWVYFHSSLPGAARGNRDLTDAAHKNSDSVLARNTIACSGVPLACSTQRPARAVGYLSWPDLAAFLDWAALRPMSELEFEKAARGPVQVYPSECSWGSADIVAVDSLSSGSEDSGAETVSTDGANAVYGAMVYSGGDSGEGAAYASGPLRGGIFASADSDRIRAGASYYGVMEMSGNVAELAVTLGAAAGIVYAASHGNGRLTVTGNADVLDWPGMDADPAMGITGSSGIGLRGGSWADSSDALRISDRSRAASLLSSDLAALGGRGVRSAGIE